MTIYKDKTYTIRIIGKKKEVIYVKLDCYMIFAVTKMFPFKQRNANNLNNVFNNFTIKSQCYLILIRISV